MAAQAAVRRLGFYVAKIAEAKATTFGSANLESQYAADNSNNAIAQPSAKWRLNVGLGGWRSASASAQ